MKVGISAKRSSKCFKSLLINFWKAASRSKIDYWDWLELFLNIFRNFRLVLEEFRRRKPEATPIDRHTQPINREKTNFWTEAAPIDRPSWPNDCARMCGTEPRCCRSIAYSSRSIASQADRSPRLSRSIAPSRRNR